MHLIVGLGNPRKKYAGSRQDWDIFYGREEKLIEEFKLGEDTV